MTTFPNSPRFLKGAIYGVDVFNPLASVILFQYNPETLTRSLTARTLDRPWWDRPARTEAFPLTGPPKEIIDLDVVESAEPTFIEPPA